MIKEFLLLVSVMTKVPVTSNYWATERDLGRSMRLLPLLGLLMGVLLAGTANFISCLSVPVAAAAVIGFYAVLTGGMHFNGLLRTIENLKIRFVPDQCPNSMTGKTNDYIVLALLLVFKYGLYLTLINRWLFWTAIPAAFVFSRFMMSWLIYYFPAIADKKTHTNDSFHQNKTDVPDSGKSLHSYFQTSYFLFSAILMAICLLLLGNLTVYLAAIPAFFLIHFLVAYWSYRLGGLDEDAYGAAVEWSEVLFLLFYLLWQGLGFQFFRS